MSFPAQGYIPTTVPIPVLRDQVTNLSRTANQNWFASDIVPTVASENSSIIEITFCFEKRIKMEVSLDGGTTFCTLNNNLSIEAQTINTYQIPVLAGDLINFRCNLAGIIRYARVTEIGGN